jgi:hypothetical protein
MPSIVSYTCIDTGNKILYVNMSYSNYNNFIIRLKENPNLMAKFIKSLNSYQIKYKIENNQIEDITEDITEDILELLKKLSI